MISTVVNRLEEGIIALLLASMTSLTFVNVVMRYVFNSGLTWALEITEFLFAWLILFGMSYGVKVGSHIGVDALVRLFPDRVQRVIGLIVVATGILYSSWLIIGGWELVSFNHMLEMEAEDSPIMLWFVYLIMPVGAALLAFRLAQVGWRIITGKQVGFNLADEAREAIDQLNHAGNAADGDKTATPSKPNA
ncbi:MULTISPECIES: TRAP transporter small permease [Thalassospira]|uniref:TRAP transporter small permease protein n=1 Tax=Thalassospira povalilytica TaxID=732237 RepID=A0A8I1M8F7_9PROT|nr:MULTISPECIES: TRAP transporter small permease [Thalassospira]MEE3043756.1 TRAP transporter small permease [Pseudomonadota bacterium]RCK27434.1 C4-dicarboxylate ABC transporter permease [Thalassospira profundimaris]KZB65177.1 C4-dicarboxylate ABC transporter permease [Thalassospira sp. MCCC 1A02491]MBN8196767.1 TRAP transporter small permease [Thalassospira povalilytica]MCC4241421.1 TRAP transporter small permease [Thalassospira povalilytica]